MVHWHGWTRLGESQPIDVQLVLYHASYAVAVQYGWPSMVTTVVVITAVT